MELSRMAVAVAAAALLRYMYMEVSSCVFVLIVVSIVLLEFAQNCLMEMRGSHSAIMEFAAVRCSVAV
jgi:hypothetical protein